MLKTNKFAVFMIIALSLLPPLSWAEVSHSFVFDSAESFSFDLNKMQQAQISNDHGALRVSVAQKTQELAKVDSAYDKALKILIDDFNFDGFNDIAVATGVGYMGVNVFYDLYLYRPAKMVFEKNLAEVSNVEVDLGKKVVKSGMKSGPHFINRVYRVNQDSLYLDEESQELQGSAIQRKTHFSPAGKPLGTSITEYDGKPVILTIVTEKATLYDKQEEGTATKMYLIKGDKVTLLDSDSAWNWLLVEYHGKSILKKWLKSESIDWDRDSPKEL